MNYENAEEVRKVVEAFESASVSRGEWGHPEHLIVAYHYTSRCSLTNAYKKMKAGIYRLLVEFGIETSREMPYHETLTMFWLTTVRDFVLENRHLGEFEACEELVSRFDKNYPLKFYSRDVLFSEEARTRYITPEEAVTLAGNELNQIGQN